MRGELSEDQWLADLEAANVVDGLTVRELIERYGMSDHWWRNRIRAAMVLGRVEFAGNKRVIAIDGKASIAPAYRIVKKEPETKRRRNRGN